MEGNKYIKDLFIKYMTPYKFVNTLIISSELVLSII